MIGPSGFFQTIEEKVSPVLTGDFELMHESEHGFNVLYRICMNGRFFVYKALKPEYRGNPVYEELLKKDFNIGFSLSHANICQYYGLVNVPSLGNCIIMEWVDGTDLESILDKGRIDKDLACKIICELSDALEYIHSKQIIHRDLKPTNILVTYNGNNVKLIDFGLSDADSYNVFKTPAGTRVYASPELLTGDHIDIRADIWSLGMIIHEIAPSYRFVVSKCLSRDLDKRFSRAVDVKKAVLTSGRRRLLIFLISIFVTILVVCGLVWLFTAMDFSSVIEREYVQEHIQLPVASEDTLYKDEIQIETDDLSEVIHEDKEQTVHSEIRSESADAEEYVDISELEEMFKDATDQLFIQ